LETDDGIVGYGESVGIFFETADTFIHKELKPLLLGENPLRVEYLRHRMEHLIEWNSFATYPISAVEMALYDLKGKVMESPVYDLLGGLYRDEVEFCPLIHIHSVEEDVANVRRLVENGCRTIKLKVGRDPRDDLVRLRAIREAVGEDVNIRIDPNMAWSPSTAIKWARRMERYNLQYLEQPVPGWDIDGLMEVGRSIEVPVAADESCQTVRDALKLAAKEACEVFIVYPSEAGGLQPVRDIVSIANTAGITCVMGTWEEGGVAFAAGLHLIASSRNFPLANDTSYHVLTEDYITSPFRFDKNFRIRVPNEPGLGVSPDPIKVTKLSKATGDDTIFRDLPGSKFIPRSRQIQ